MRANVLWCAVAWLVAMPAMAWAEAEPVAIAEAYLTQLVAKQPEKGFAELMTHSTVDEVKPREIQLLKGQIEQALSFYGAPSGFEQILDRPYGASTVRLIYITKHRDTPLVWNFFFYRTAEGWSLVTLRFSDQLQALEP